MLRSLIWFLLAAAWALDAARAWALRHDPRRALVAAIAALCFAATGLYWRRREARARIRAQAGSRPL